MKLITFAIPCYNSEAYIDRCLENLLHYEEDVEVIIVNDGSTDMTGEISTAYAKRYPHAVKVIHQENGGHGEAVNTGLQHATGLYFKVVDSDDWLDRVALDELIENLKILRLVNVLPDLVICNYVYEKLSEGMRRKINYREIFPVSTLFSWDEMKRIPPWKFLLMHSVIYKTQLLHDCGLKLPRNTFYVDNLFVYKPLPYVQTAYYMDLDLYRYFIGREDQSVNEKVMVSQIDQQLKVTRLMLAYNHHMTEVSPKLTRYLMNYLCMMIIISTVFLRIAGTPESLVKEKELWDFLKHYYPNIYHMRSMTLLRMLLTLPGNSGNVLTIQLYRFARKIYKFN